MKIQVTAADIKKARVVAPNRLYNCPVECAVRRALHRKVWVAPRLLCVFFKGFIRQYRLPASVENFVSRFDEGKQVKPFTFNAKYLWTIHPARIYNPYD